MCLNEEFIKNPVQFAHDYAIIPRAASMDGPVYIRQGRFSFEKSEEFTAGGIAKKGAVDLISHSEGFESYWLPYNSNKSKRLLLGTDYPYMFTANMDGCSFAVGSQTQTGALMVVHANAASEGGKAFFEASKIHDPYAADSARVVQSARQQKMILGKKLDLDKKYTIFDPHHYIERTSDVTDSNILSFQATVFGFLEDNHWHIYAQRRTKMAGRVFVVRDVIPIC